MGGRVALQRYFWGSTGSCRPVPFHKGDLWGSRLIKRSSTSGSGAVQSDEEVEICPRGCLEMKSSRRWVEEKWKCLQLRGGRRDGVVCGACRCLYSSRYMWGCDCWSKTSLWESRPPHVILVPPLFFFFTLLLQIWNSKNTFDINWGLRLF